MNSTGFIFDPDDPSITYAAIVQASNALFVRSTNQGVSWDTIFNFREQMEYPYSSYSPCGLTVRIPGKEFFLGMLGGVILRSKDKGKSWQIVHKTFSDSLWHGVKVPNIRFMETNSRFGFAVMANGMAGDPLKTKLPQHGLYRTMDGGETWQHIAFKDTSLWALDVRYNDIGYGYVLVGSFNSVRDVVALSTDVGETWKLMDIPWLRKGDGSVWDVRFQPNTWDEVHKRKDMWASTNQGLFVFEPTTSSAEEDAEKSSSSIRLLCSAEGRISVPYCSEAQSIKIYSSFGDLIFREDVTNKNLDNYNIDISSYPTGVYFASVSHSKGAKNYRFPHVR
jgi:hypothetical protein